MYVVVFVVTLRENHSLKPSVRALERTVYIDMNVRILFVKLSIPFQVIMKSGNGTSRLTPVISST